MYYTYTEVFGYPFLAFVAAFGGTTIAMEAYHRRQGFGFSRNALLAFMAACVFAGFAVGMGLLWYVAWTLISSAIFLIVVMTLGTFERQIARKVSDGIEEVEGKKIAKGLLFFLAALLILAFGYVIMRIDQGPLAEEFWSTIFNICAFVGIAYFVKKKFIG